MGSLRGGTHMEEVGYQNAHAHLFLSVSLPSGYRSPLSHGPTSLCYNTAPTLVEHSETTIEQKLQNREPKDILFFFNKLFSRVLYHSNGKLT